MSTSARLDKIVIVDDDAPFRQRLARAGVPTVLGGGVCTVSDAARWYSYRRDARPDADTGRLATLVWQERVTL